VVVVEELMQFQDLLVYQVDLEVVEVEDVLQQQVQETLLLQVLLKEIVVEQVVLLLLLVVVVVEQQQQDVLDHQVKVEMVEHGAPNSITGTATSYAGGGGGSGNDPNGRARGVVEQVVVEMVKEVEM
jgi:hypothetical protein